MSDKNVKILEDVRFVLYGAFAFFVLISMILKIIGVI